MGKGIVDVAADDLLLAASSHESVAGLGKNTDEPRRKETHIYGFLFTTTTA